MTIVIDALKMCEDNIIKFKEEVNKIEKAINKKPEFVIINASNSEANARYIKGKIAEGEKAGLKVTVIKFEENCTNTDVLEVIYKCNKEKIPMILQLPVFDHLDKNLLISCIDPTVDADGFTKEWIGEINLGNDRQVAPATPKGVMNLLDYHNVELKGKIALVIGKSNHVGKPLASMLINKSATVLVANKDTKDLKSLIQMADIIVSCVGKLDLIKAEDLKQNVVLIGVGFTYVGKKQILDFDLDEVIKSNKAFLVSNRINCTGKATINSLISNVIELYKLNWEV